MEKIAVKLSENIAKHIKNVYGLEYKGNNEYFHYPNFFNHKGFIQGFHTHPDLKKGYYLVSEDSFFENLYEVIQKESIAVLETAGLSKEEESIRTVMSKGFIEKTPSHYDNTNGSLYQIAKQRGWDAYQFEIVKRIDRCYKKGEFKSDLEKTKAVIDIWLSECDTNLLNEKEVLNAK